MLLQTDTRTFFELQPVVPLGAAWEIAVGLLIGLGMFLMMMIMMLMMMMLIFS